MFLKPVPLDAYVAFAASHFDKGRKQIDDGVVEAIYERFEGTTWYLQKVLNQLYATREHAVAEYLES